MLVLLIACRGAPSPVDRPLPWDDARETLTIAYAHQHTGPDQDLLITPRIAVLHGTPDPTLDALWDRFAPTELPGDRGDLAWAGTVNVSTHFAVAQDGTIVQLLPEDRYARHVVGFNHAAIGIEHLGDGPEHALTPAQVAATAALVRALAARHPIRWLAGHHELIDAEHHPLFLERDPDYRTFALDPGDAFVDAVAARVADLGLERVTGP